MQGCLLWGTFALITSIFTAIFRLVVFVLMLMVTSIASLFVGIEAAVDRIAFSWIEQFSGNGISIGYNPVTRGGVKAAAVMLLVLGWLLNLGVIYLLVRAATGT